MTAMNVSDRKNSVSRSESLRRQFHRGSAAALDARQMQRGFRQYPLHEETAGDELGGEIWRGAGGGDLVLDDLRHPRPHVAEGDETKQLHVIGGGSAGIVGLCH